MPIFEYKCIKCNHIMEILSSYNDLDKKEETLKCEKCGGQVGRKIAPFVTHFNYTRGSKE